MVPVKSRSLNEMRPVTFELNFTQWAEGSVLCKFGDTHVLCNATIEDDVPAWMKKGGNERGWLTAEYAMLPRSTHDRRRDRLCPDGRSQEISRLIGRALRMAVNLELMGPRQLIVDCTVLQADGGTRTAAVTGGWVAARLALQRLIDQNKIRADVIRHQVAAVSVGIVDGQPVLDLAYEQDSQADVDLNVVMTAGGQLVEIQGTGEQEPFTREQMGELVELAWQGIQQLVERQNDALAPA